MSVTLEIKLIEIIRYPINFNHCNWLTVRNVATQYACNLTNGNIPPAAAKSCFYFNQQQQSQLSKSQRSIQSDQMAMVRIRLFSCLSHTPSPCLLCRPLVKSHPSGRKVNNKFCYYRLHVMWDLHLVGTVTTHFMHHLADCIEL